MIEIEDILNLWFKEDNPPTEEEVQKLGLRWGERVNGGKGWVSDVASRLIQRALLTTMGSVECPSPGCGNWVQPLMRGAAERCACETCGLHYCTGCLRPYHYGCKCDEVVTLQRLWVDWKERGLERYLEEMAREDAGFSDAMADFRRRKEEHDADAALAADNFQNLLRDEQEKARTCRRCPSCHRTVQKIDGCDSMVCGRNYHGGNQQNGCGTHFSWSTAPPYIADAGNQPNIPNFNDVPPQEAAKYHHYIIQDQPELCSDCGGAVVGPKATCIHCVGGAYVLCVRCQAKPHADGSHIFRLDMGSK